MKKKKHKKHKKQSKRIIIIVNKNQDLNNK